MLREAPLATGQTRTAGHARATSELHSAVRSGTAGRGPNRDHGPRISARDPQGEPRAASGPECYTEDVTLSGPTRTYASTHAYLGTAGRGIRRGPQVASGPEELRDSEWSRGP